jgi:MFS family permease
MLLSHTAGPYARGLMITGGLIVGFTVVSAFSATRVYLSEQFPTALRGRGHIFGESCGKIFGGGLVPFFMAPHTGSPTIFFGTMLLFAAIGAFVPIVWGKETIGQIEVIAAEPRARGASRLKSGSPASALRR